MEELEQMINDAKSGDAMHELGLRFLFGDGVDIDYDKSL